MIALTGATGLVGSRIAFALVSAGVPVKAIYRDPKRRLGVKRAFRFYGAAPGLFEAISWHRADVLDMEGLAQTFAGCEAVFHCAAKVSFDSNDDREVLRCNYEGTRTVVNAALDAGVCKLVHVGSVASLGPPNAKGEIDEQCLWKDGYKPSVYAQSKYLAEMEVRRGEAEGLQVLVLQPSIVLGPAEGGRSSASLMHLLYRGSRFYPSGALGVVDVRDVAAAALRLYLKDACWGESFLLNASNSSLRELLQTAAALSGAASPRWPLHGRVLQFLSALDALRSTVFKSRRKLSRASVAAVTSPSVYSSAKLQAELDFAFIDPRDSLRYYYPFYRQLSGGGTRPTKNAHT